MIKQIKKSLKNVQKAYFNKTSEVNPNPVFILGNEKSGTSVMAFLIAELSGSSVTIDIHGTWNPVQTQLKRGEVTLEQVIARNKYDFSKDIIKEPVLTFEYENLKRLFPGAKFLLILREPKSNLRSILNRLKIDGRKEQLETDDLCHLSQKELVAWNPVLFNDWLGYEYENYIESLALRWNFCAALGSEKDINVVRYEDFLDNKEETIKHCASVLGLRHQKSIAHLVDIQHQFKGDNSHTYLEFFGDKNLKRIENTCNDFFKKYYGDN
jgi:hypothetical protein